MPFYSYICQRCNSVFEAFASFEKKERGWKPVCPNCGSRDVRQEFTAAVRVGKSSVPPRQGGCCNPR